jgi:hypothetical protein
MKRGDFVSLKGHPLCTGIILEIKTHQRWINLQQKEFKIFWNPSGLSGVVFSGHGGPGPVRSLIGDNLIQLVSEWRSRETEVICSNRPT